MISTAAPVAIPFSIYDGGVCPLVNIILLHLLYAIPLYYRTIRVEKRE